MRIGDDLAGGQIEPHRPGAVGLLDLLEPLLLEDVHRGAVTGHGQAQTAPALLLRKLDQRIEQLGPMPLPRRLGTTAMATSGV